MKVVIRDEQPRVDLERAPGVTVARPGAPTEAEAVVVVEPVVVVQPVAVPVAAPAPAPVSATAPSRDFSVGVKAG